MSNDRVEVRPHVLQPERCTVSVFRNNVLVYTRVQPKNETLELAEQLCREGFSIDWNHESGEPYRAWRQSHELV
jgi:hypothetical protein